MPTEATEVPLRRLARAQFHGRPFRTTLPFRTTRAELACALAAALSLAACTLDGDGRAAGDGGLDAAADAEPGLDGAEPCTAAEDRCEDGMLLRCEGGGQLVITMCPSGCDADAPAPACAPRAPTHVPASVMLPTSDADWVVDGDAWVVNTDTGEIRDEDDQVVRAAGPGDDDDVGYVLAEQDAGPDLGVFVLGEFTIEEGARLLATGGAALVIVASGNVNVDGVLDVSANGAVSGPGGGALGNGGDGPYVKPAIGGYLHGAGGGGSNVAAGGLGGTHMTPTGNSGGGAAGPVLADLSYLRGGGSGGRGVVGQHAPASATRIDGGGGGGAVQITSAGEIRVGATGVVRAHGGGGAASPSGAGGDDYAGSGGGGGAGGTIWLEAEDIEVLGKLAANGGGGGAGRTTSPGTPRPGSPGSDSLTRAPGGISSDPSPFGAWPGAGGGGAAGEMLAGAAGGAGSGLGVGGGGGGGGGAGRVVLRSLGAPELGSAVLVSPSAAPALDTGDAP